LPVITTVSYFYGLNNSMRFKASYITISVIAVLIAMFGNSCKKVTVLSTGGILKFSTDTLKFDTVFTAEGSFTTGVLIYNPQDKEVIVSSVRLQGGATSYFHLNVDGFSGNNVSNIKIAAHDSVYVFATVTINPTDTTTPFLITDELIATLNGKDFSIPFTAYGQNAYYIISDSFTVNTIWHTDKPYVVIHSCEVGPGVTLSIPAKCRVYMHQDARFFVYGKLAVDTSGVPGQDSVVFQGDRLDRAYFGYIGYPGEWGGFYFVGGSGGGTGVIRNAVIKNCGGSSPYYNYGIQPSAIEVDTGAQLLIDHSIITNSIGYGILSLQGQVVATNCLVNTTGAEALAIIKGGYDSITNCTFANYGSAAVSHANNGTVAILNYFNNGDGTWAPGNLNAVLRNCIVWGSLDSEIVLDSLGGATAYVNLDHCLLKTGTVIEHFVHTPSCIFNNDPLFKDNTWNYRLSTGSPAIDKGYYIPGIGATDLDGAGRVSGMSIDIGCFEYH